VNVFFDAAPDGRFVMVRPVGVSSVRSSELVFVENFFRELTSKTKLK